MRKVAYCAILLSLFVHWLGSAQEVSKRLTNQDIIEMVKLGLSNDVIISKIRSANGVVIRPVIANNQWSGADVVENVANDDPSCARIGCNWADNLRPTMDVSNNPS